jgi:hypothetical protein
VRGYTVPLEERVAFLDVSKDRRGDASVLLVESPTQYDLRRGSGHHVSETLKVIIGNDAREAVVGRKDAIVAELHGCLLDRLHEFILSRARDKDVIRSHANLRNGGRRFSRRILWCTVRTVSLSRLTWPAFTVLPYRTRFAAILRFVVLGSMATGDFPPSSRVTGVRYSAAAFAMIRATTPFPVYVTDGRQTGADDEHTIDSMICLIIRTVVPL